MCWIFKKLKPILEHPVFGDNQIIVNFFSLILVSLSCQNICLLSVSYLQVKNSAVY